MFELILSFIRENAKDVSPARMFESAILLGIIWSKLKPELKKVNDRLEGLEKAVTSGFKSGEERFTRIEARLAAVEKTKPIQGGLNEEIGII